MITANQMLLKLYLKLYQGVDYINPLIWGVSFTEFTPEFD